MSFVRLVSSPSRHGSGDPQRITYLDGWRGLAILLVLQGHFFIVPGWHSGRMGVDVFFVLSGLLMSRILFVRRTPLVTFYKRRIARIVPAFFLYLLIVFGMAAVLGHAAPWKEVVPTVLFVRSYFPADAHMFLSPYPIGHLWSLNVEEHCYIFLSLVTLMVFLRGREGWALILVGIGSIVVHLFYFTHPEVAPLDPYWTHTEVAATNLMLSAGYALVKDRFTPHVRPWMPVAAFAIASAFYVGSVVNWMLTMTVAPFFLAFSVNHLAEAPEWVRRALSFAPLRLMGLGSFSIYLWQQPFYQYDDVLFAGVPGQMAILMALGIAAGFLSFYGFESRVRAYLNRVW